MSVLLDVVRHQAVMAPIAKATKTTNKSTPPRAFEFSVGHPTGLTALDVDLIKVKNITPQRKLVFCFQAMK